MEGRLNIIADYVDCQVETGNRGNKKVNGAMALFRENTAFCLGANDSGKCETTGRACRQKEHVMQVNINLLGKSLGEGIGRLLGSEFARDLTVDSYDDTKGGRTGIKITGSTDVEIDQLQMVEAFLNRHFGGGWTVESTSDGSTQSIVAYPRQVIASRSASQRNLRPVREEGELRPAGRRGRSKQRGSGKFKHRAR